MASVSNGDIMTQLTEMAGAMATKQDVEELKGLMKQRSHSSQESKSTMSGLKFLCIVASVREGRMAERMMKLVKSQFEKTMAPAGHTLTIMDPEDYNLPMLKQPLHFYRDPSEAPAVLHTMNKMIMEADAYLIVTPEYNRCVPPALVNTIDHFPPTSFDHKISGIIAYTLGVTGGSFGISAVRPLLTEMGCLPVKNFVSVNRVANEIKEDGTTENSHIYSALDKLFKEVGWWANAAKMAKANES